MFGVLGGPSHGMLLGNSGEEFEVFGWRPYGVETNVLLHPLAAASAVLEMISLVDPSLVWPTREGAECFDCFGGASGALPLAHPNPTRKVLKHPPRSDNGIVP